MITGDDLRERYKARLDEDEIIKEYIAENLNVEEIVDDYVDDAGIDFDDIVLDYNILKALANDNDNHISDDIVYDWCYANNGDTAELLTDNDIDTLIADCVAKGWLRFNADDDTNIFVMKGADLIDNAIDTYIHDNQMKSPDILLAEICGVIAGNVRLKTLTADKDRLDAEKKEKEKKDMLEKLESEKNELMAKLEKVKTDGV